MRGIQSSSSAKLTFDAFHIRLVNGCRMRQISLLLRSLLRQDVTLKGMLSLDFSTPCKFETLLGASFGFHLRHGLGFFGYFFFGLNMIVIRLPSNRGNCSTTPISSNSCANFNKISHPVL
jgi:hypothetical protein